MYVEKDLLKLENFFQRFQGFIRENIAKTLTFNAKYDHHKILIVTECCYFQCTDSLMFVIISVSGFVLE